jgi:hypothetical protein
VGKGGVCCECERCGARAKGVVQEQEAWCECERCGMVQSGMVWGGMVQSGAKEVQCMHVVQVQQYGEGAGAWCRYEVNVTVESGKWRWVQNIVSFAGSRAG